jgi:GxxExxY protein
MIEEELTGKIIGAFYVVYNALGHGFLEKVYENALLLELRKLGLRAEQQKRVPVFYDEQLVGDYFADIIVENAVVLELKAADAIAPEHEAQLINYLKGTEIEVGLLLNFGPKPQFVRKIFTNDKKNIRRG